MQDANETILFIDLKKLEKNYSYLRKKLNQNTKIIGVVKAFGYGHGDIEVSKKLEKIGVYALWVTDFEEGVNLRKAGIKSKIIVANPGKKSYAEIIKHKLDIIIYNYSLLDLYIEKREEINIHIKFNTGMNRYGFEEKDLDKIIKKINNQNHIKLLSICSHLASSEKKELNSFTMTQINRFKKLSKKFEKKIKKPILKHILNTHGVLNFNFADMDMVRLGVGLYGCTNHKNLLPISRLNSVVTQKRSLKKGENVGYGNSYVCERNMDIAVVPVGYADGLNRRLSNGVGKVYIKNKYCKIIGKISMGTFTVDVTNLNIEEGDIVEIFGENISVLSIAKSINTITYEVLSTLNRRIKRVYLNN
tara:strand:- start:852 stop:1934 length:1083 start_codon:yes stop_codon:yes gene_type:complete